MEYHLVDIIAVDSCVKELVQRIEKSHNLNNFVVFAQNVSNLFLHGRALRKDLTELNNVREIDLENVT